MSPDRPAGAAPGLLSPDLDDLGVSVHDGGGTLRVWSERAESLELVVFDDADLDWSIADIPLAPVGGGVWSVTSELLTPGSRYAVRADGPRGTGDMFNRGTLLVEPYSRGLATGDGYEDWRSVVVDRGYDWGGVTRPGTPMDRTVI